MSDWQRQMDEMLRTWTQLQREMWAGWTKTVSSAGARPTEAWEQAMTAWNDAVRRSVTAPMEWAQLWAENMKASSRSGQDMSAWSEQMLSMTKAWTETQNKFWESWLEIVRNATPDAMKGLDTAAQQAFKTWQETVQKAMEAQQEFVRTWTSNIQEKK